jgi:hypothetical protein
MVVGVTCPSTDDAKSTRVMRGRPEHQNKSLCNDKSTYDRTPFYGPEEHRCSIASYAFSI